MSCSPPPACYAPGCGWSSPSTRWCPRLARQRLKWRAATTTQVSGSGGHLNNAVIQFFYILLSKTMLVWLEPE
jgi:hypothetical protein